ncbi:MAG: hypothetical protein M3Y76_10400 [Chloroflexota bacterium]|nr:hypothetical protein [Chloroflexota bacterium]
MRPLKLTDRHKRWRKRYPGSVLAWQQPRASSWLWRSSCSRFKVPPRRLLAHT